MRARVSLRISDEYGALRPQCSDPISIALEGPGLLLGESLAALSGGVPRSINRICYNSLLEAHAQGARTVTPEIVAQANRQHDLLIAQGEARMRQYLGRARA